MEALDIIAVAATLIGQCLTHTQMTRLSLALLPLTIPLHITGQYCRMVMRTTGQLLMGSISTTKAAGHDFHHIFVTMNIIAKIALYLMS